MVPNRKTRLLLSLLACTLPASAFGQTTLKTAPNIQLQQPTLQTAPQINVQAVALPPEITGIRQTGCIAIGQALTVLGKNFGSQTGRSIALLGHGIHVDLKIVSWSTNTIETVVPNDTRLASDKTYNVGIENSSHTQWLSNFRGGISICSRTAAAPSAIAITAPATAITTIKPITSTTPALTPPPQTQPQTKTAPQPGAAPANNMDTPANRVQPPQYLPQTFSPQVAANQAAGNYWYADNTGTQGVQADRGGSLIDRGIPPAPPVPKIADKKSADQYEPGQIVIMTSGMDESNELVRRLAEYNIRIKTRQTMKNLGLVINVFRLPDSMEVLNTIETLRYNFPGIWVDSNQRFGLQGDPRKRYGAAMSGWENIKPDCGKNLRIGLIDTAVDKNHPALAGQKITTRNFLNAGIPAAPPEHGTAIAGLLIGKSAAADFAGLLPAASLYVAEVFRLRGKQNETTVEWLVQAMDWLLGEKPGVINMSLGGQRNLIVELAVSRAIELGVLIVAAAGNNGRDDEPVYPAAQAGVIAVTAIDSERKLYRDASKGDYISFAAPGVDIWSADAKGKGVFNSGTSYATPYVTAAAALWRQRNPKSDWSRELVKHAVDLGPPGKDPSFGWGLIQWNPQC